jgi:hypothetical protein
MLGCGRFFPLQCVVENGREIEIAELPKQLRILQCSQDMSIADEREKIPRPGCPLHLGILKQG